MFRANLDNICTVCCASPWPILYLPRLQHQYTPECFIGMAYISSKTGLAVKLVLVTIAVTTILSWAVKCCSTVGWANVSKPKKFQE